MVHYAQPELLSELCTVDMNVGTILVEVIATVLDNEVSYYNSYEQCNAENIVFATNFILKHYCFKK